MTHLRPEGSARHPSQQEQEHRDWRPVYFGFDLPLRPRRLKPAFVPYPKAVVVPPHELITKWPDTAEAAKTFLMKYKETLSAYVNAAGAASDFVSWGDNALITGGQILYDVLRKNQRSQIGFGIPRVRGFGAGPSQSSKGTDSIEVPFPGWMLRSLSFSGPVNSRDIALFFKLIAICNIYEENFDRDDNAVTETDVLTWSVPYRNVVGGMFKGHLDRATASLGRLNATSIRPVDDILNPRRKLNPNMRLIQSFSVQDRFLTFSLDKYFCKAVLGQTRYAHVNVRTLCTLRSMYGVRAYLLGLGFCALGAWSRSGGVTRVLMTETNLKHILLENPLVVRDGEFRRDVLRQVRKDLNKICYVSDEEAEGHAPSYDGRERMRMQIIQHPRNEPGFFDGFNSHHDGVGLYFEVAAAPRLHRVKHVFDARMLNWRSRKQIYDLEAIRTERNKKRSLGVIEALARRNATTQVRSTYPYAGGASPSSTAPIPILGSDASKLFDQNSSKAQGEGIQEANTWTLREAFSDQEDDDDEDLDIAPEDEDDDNPEGYIYPPEDD